MRDHSEHVQPQTPPRGPGNELLLFIATPACYKCDSKYFCVAINKNTTITKVEEVSPGLQQADEKIYALPGKFDYKMFKYTICFLRVNRFSGANSFHVLLELNHLYSRTWVAYDFV